MAENSNNPPYAVVELDKASYDFIMKNCDDNIVFGLNALMAVSEDSARKLVDLMESFKAIKVSLEKGKL